MKIRPYQTYDLFELSELYLKTRTEKWRWLDASKWALSDFEDHTQNEIILVAEDDGRYLGFASIYIQENFLHNLFISPKEQDRGVGSALLKAAENLFTDTAYLKCLTENKSAVVFYLKKGWKIESTGRSDDGDYFLMSKMK